MTALEMKDFFEKTFVEHPAISAVGIGCASPARRAESDSDLVAPNAPRFFGRVAAIAGPGDGPGVRFSGGSGKSPKKRPAAEELV